MIREREQEVPDAHPEARQGDAEDRAPRPREVGGPKGPEPTRYGDWERAGRCIDF
ncbi:MAG TPA: succinate dehydrogenase assembly factor 4 [Gammaproteobacteria bacterium]